MVDTITLLMVVARALHYGAALVLFGYCLFSGALLHGESILSSRSNCIVIIMGVAVFLLSAVAWLMGEAAIAGDGMKDALHPGVLWSVLTETSFGPVFSLQLILGLVMLMVLPSGGLRILTLVSGLSLAALAGIGHAVMFGGLWDVALTATQALHLLAGGFWIGGLLAIAMRPTEMGPGWRAALMQFSNIGHVAVALVILSGIAMGIALLGMQSGPWNRLYLGLLLAKAAIVLVMAAFAVFNRYVLVPRLSKSAAARQHLMHVVRFNLVLSAAVIVLISVLGQLSPSIDQQ